MDEVKLVKALKALADKNRLRMVREIAAAGELTCGQVKERFHLSQPTVSHHLKLLVDAGVLGVRQSGQHHFISVNLALIHEVGTFLPGGVVAAARAGVGLSRVQGHGVKRTAGEKRRSSRWPHAFIRRAE